MQCPIEWISGGGYGLNGYFYLFMPAEETATPYYQVVDFINNSKMSTTSSYDLTLEAPVTCVWKAGHGALNS